MRMLLLVLLLVLAAGAEPRRVTIVSQPAGAEIHDQQGEYLGLTGQEISVDFARYGGQPLRFSLKLAGYQPVSSMELRAEQVESGRFPEQGAIPLVSLGGGFHWGWTFALLPLVLLVVFLRRPSSLEKAPVAPASVRRLGGYALEELLGQGGMGKVYRASRGGERVALKVLQAPEDAEMRAEFVQRWQRESNITSRLNHRGIVRVLDYGSEGDEYFIAMELLSGATLSSVADVRDTLRQLVLAMGYAHRQGVVHRDLKPENIMVLPGGQLKVMDFGLARAENSANLTQSGQALGTVAYMAPEQFMGSSCAESDQYAVGLIAYQLLTGRLPYDPLQDSMQTMMWHLQGAVSPPSFFNQRLSPALDAVILRMLEKQPEKRFPSLEAAWVALDGAL